MKKQKKTIKHNENVRLGGIWKGVTVKESDIKMIREELLSKLLQK